MIDTKLVRQKIYIVIFVCRDDKNEIVEQNVIAYENEENAIKFVKKYNSIVKETNEFKLLKEDFPHLKEDYGEPLAYRTGPQYYYQSLSLYY